MSKDLYMKDLIIYMLAAIVTAIIIIYMWTLWEMVMYKDCINHTNNIYYCEAKWK